MLFTTKESDITAGARSMSVVLDAGTSPQTPVCGACVVGRLQAGEGDWAVSWRLL